MVGGGPDETNPYTELSSDRGPRQPPTNSTVGESSDLNTGSSRRARLIGASTVAAVAVGAAIATTIVSNPSGHRPPALLPPVAIRRTPTGVLVETSRHKPSRLLIRVDNIYLFGSTNQSPVPPYQAMAPPYVDENMDVTGAALIPEGDSVVIVAVVYAPDKTARLSVIDRPNEVEDVSPAANGVAVLAVRTTPLGPSPLIRVDLEGNNLYNTGTQAE